MAQSRSTTLPQDLATEIGVEDLYEFLGVDSASTEKEITSGYRKKALKYHPDKNPDNPNASDLFQKLSKAYNILTDPAAKAAYDKWLKAKFAAKQRHDELNSKRKKLKESLESRESQYTHNWADEREAAKKMQKEIERLREEGFKKMKEQEEALRQQLLKPECDDDPDTLPTLKVTWKAKKSDESNGGYSMEALREIFSKFGPIHHVLVSSRRNGKALVSFHQATNAMLSLDSVLGSPNNPLKVTWVSGEPSAAVISVRSGDVGGVQAKSAHACMQDTDNIGSSGDGYLERGNNYESVTLMRLRQAEERKRLCQQLQEQDEQLS